MLNGLQGDLLLAHSCNHGDSSCVAPGSLPAIWPTLDVKADLHDVPVLYHISAAFQAQQPTLPGFGK